MNQPTSKQSEESRSVEISSESGEKKKSRQQRRSEEKKSPAPAKSSRGTEEEKPKKKPIKDYDPTKTLCGYAQECNIGATRIPDIMKYEGGGHNAMVHIYLFDDKVGQIPFDNACTRARKAQIFRLMFRNGNKTLFFVKVDKRWDAGFSKLYPKVQAHRLDQQAILGLVKDVIWENVRSGTDSRNWEPMRITFLTKILLESGWELKDCFAGAYNMDLEELKIHTSNIRKDNASSRHEAKKGGRKALEEFEKREAEILTMTDEQKEALWTRFLNWWQSYFLDLYTPLVSINRIINKHILKSIQDIRKVFEYRFHRDEEKYEIIDGNKYEINSEEWMVRKMVNETDTMRDKFRRQAISLVDLKGRSGKSDLAHILGAIYGWAVIEVDEKGATEGQIKQGIIDEMDRKPNARGLLIDLGRVQSNNQKLVEDVFALIEKLRSPSLSHCRYQGRKISLSTVDYVVVLSNNFLPYSCHTADRWIIHVLEDLEDETNEFARSLTSVDLSTVHHLSRDEVCEEMSSLAKLVTRRRVDSVFYKEGIKALKMKGKKITWRTMERMRQSTLNLYESTSDLQYERDPEVKKKKGEIRKGIDVKYRRAKKISVCDFKEVLAFLQTPYDEFYTKSFKEIIERLTTKGALSVFTEIDAQILAGMGSDSECSERSEKEESEIKQPTVKQPTVRVIEDQRKKLANIDEQIRKARKQNKRQEVKEKKVVELKQAYDAYLED